LDPEGTEIMGSNVTVVTTKMTCTFDLVTKPAGTYDVQFTLNGGTAILPADFSIQQPVPLITALFLSFATAGGPGFTLNRNWQ
jgi:hypothetical protein